MKVLMISGDKNFVPGNSRYDLQRSTVDELDVFVWPQVHSLWQIFSAARRNRYDVITAQDPFWRGHLAHHLVQLFGGRLNIQVHTDLSVYSPLKRLFARLQLRNADSIRVVSEKIKTQVLTMGAKGRIMVLPVFVDVSRFRALQHEPQQQKTILWIGRFEPEKNPEEAIAIWKKVRNADIGDVGLVILGAGSLLDHLNQLRIQSVREMKNVSFKIEDWQNPFYYFARADVVISTSKHESYGVSIIEALAAGVPVVAPNVGVAKEAGANVVAPENLAEEVIHILKTGQRGKLKLHLLDKEEWARLWKESL